MDWIRLLTHPVVIECITNKIPITIENGICKVHGFYKSDYAELIATTNASYLNALTRYDGNNIIKTFKDLVDLNFDWWLEYGYRDGKNPPDHWLEQFKRFNLVEIKIETKEIIKPK